MRNIGFTLSLIILTVATANAQIAIEGGLNMSNMSIKEADTKLATKFRTGGAVGIVGDLSFNEHVYFQPGLFYQTAGCVITGPPSGEYDLNTITIPLNIEYKAGEKCNSRFFAGAGPYVCKNLSGTFSRDSYGPVPSSSGSLNIGTDIKALDLGLGVNVGYQIKKHFYFRLHYQVGLTNLDASGDSKNSTKTSAIGFTMGFLFGGCRNSGDSFFRNSPSHWRGIKKGKHSQKALNYHKAWL